MMSKMDRWRRALGRGGALAALLLVVSCGGGEQVKAFAPGRVIVFGDETSVIDDFNRNANGRKYTDNATVSTSDATLDCKLNPIWVQVLATTAYGLVFPECNPAPNAVAAPASRIRATIGATVSNFASQIDAQIAESPFTATDLVTVLLGQNDILAAYAQYPAVSEATLTATVEAAGVQIGAQVNRIALTGAKVLLSTVPDQGLTPFAFAERAAHVDIDRSGLLTRLTARLNATMRATIINDGRMIGLILTDEYFRAVESVANGGGFTNVLDPVCIPPSALNCTSLTLVSGGSGATYLWADRTHLSSGGQLQLGSLAATRARDNPF